MERFRKQLKLWFAWDSDRIENYLEEMSMQGWHTAQIDGLLVNFLFERGEPKHMRYCMDYQREDKAEYRQLCIDDGWTLLHSSIGWYVWCKEYDGERPNLYTDLDSLIARNRSILIMVAVVFFTQAPMITLNANNLAHVMHTNPVIFVMLVAILAAAYGLLVYCMVRLSITIRKLRSRKG